jgi:delta-aminolevulinic acid dehydratase/porphobilinogen synthase
VELLKANYDTWIRELMVQEGCDHVVLQPGQYLSDVISSIVKSSQPLENNTLSLNVFV